MSFLFLPRDYFALLLGVGGAGVGGVGGGGEGRGAGIARSVVFWTLGTNMGSDSIP